MTFELFNIDWTAISAIATLVMAIATFFTLRQNRKQLQEMKRQWVEDKKPILVLSLVKLPFHIDSVSYGIEIRNIGKSVASDVKVDIDEDFLSSVPVKSIKKNADIVFGKKFGILPNENLVKPICELQEHRFNEGSIFGQAITYDEEKQLNLFFQQNPISITYKFKGDIEYTVKTNFVFSEALGIHWSIQDILSNISMQLGNIKFEISQLNDKTNNG